MIESKDLEYFLKQKKIAEDELKRIAELRKFFDDDTVFEKDMNMYLERLHNIYRAIKAIEQRKTSN